MKYLLYFLVTFLQPICLLNPEATTIYFGIKSIGAKAAFVIGLIGILCGIVFMYKLTFHLSNRYLKNLKKTEKFKIYKKYVSKNPFLTTGILFVIPIIPDEIICVGSALGGIPLKELFPIALFTKTISVGMVTFSETISNWISVEEWVIVLCEIIFMLLIALLYKFIRDKKEFSETN